MDLKYKKIKDNGVYKISENISFLEVTGSDAANYINTQTTNDVLVLEVNKGLSNNLVDRKAHFKAHFTMHRLQDKYFILMEKVQSEVLKEHLENFHFTEDFELNDLSEQKEIVLLRGESTYELLNELFEKNISIMDNYDVLEVDFNTSKSYLIANNEYGEDAILCIFDKSNSELKNSLFKLIEKYDIPELDDTTAEVLRIEEGIPRYNHDFDANNILPETGFEKYSVSYSKGCYLGQEVIARIKTYGTVPNALIGLIFADDSAPYNSEIIIEGKKAGIVKSGIFSPTLNKNIAFAYLKKDYRKPEETINFSIEDKNYSAVIKLLPFIEPVSREEKAKKYYEKALIVFAENKEDEAVILLKKAIKNKPDFSDAYESLGVILSRLEKFEEAIEIMTKLTEIAPDEPMARTNLSIFYMKIGNKEEAEAQMAKATTIKFMNAMKENKNKKALEQKKQEELEAIRERMEMFKEVLETEDPEDLIANYGMGKSHFDLDEYKDAIPYFQKAIELKKDYSMAYLYLGKSLEKIENTSDALEIYQKGIVAASQKGDLMPLKEMEQRKLVLSQT